MDLVFKARQRGSFLNALQPLSGDVLSSDVRKGETAAEREIAMHKIIAKILIFMQKTCNLKDKFTPELSYLVARHS